MKLFPFHLKNTFKKNPKFYKLSKIIKSLKNTKKVQKNLKAKKWT